MKSWLGVFHQEGGCDHTIACGTRVLRLQAPTREAAHEALYREFIQVGGRYVGIGCIDLYEAGLREYISPNVFSARQRDEEQAEAATKEEQEARDLYEELKARFGPEGE